MAGPFCCVLQQYTQTHRASLHMKVETVYGTSQTRQGNLVIDLQPDSGIRDRDIELYSLVKVGFLL